MKIVYSGIDSVYESDKDGSKESSKEVDTKQQEEENTKDNSKGSNKGSNKDNKNSKEEENALLNGTTIECPECGSTDVNITNDGESFHCSNCEHTWSVRDADDDGLDDDDEDMIDSMTEELDESGIEKGSFYKQHDGNCIYVVESSNGIVDVLDINSGVRKHEDINIISKSIKECVTVEDVSRV